MQFSKILSLLTLLPAALAIAFPSPQGSSGSSSGSSNKCKKPTIRKEWRQLTTAEKNSFHQALACMHKKPSALAKEYKYVGSRYEDFAAAHKITTPYYHFTAYFLIWHRQYMSQFEHELQTQCGLKIGLPYWDYTIDAYPGGNITASPVFHPVHGFGGNGAYNPDPEVSLPGHDLWGGGCLYNGPYKDWKFTLPPGRFWEAPTGKRCFTRNIYPQFQIWAYQYTEDAVLAQPDFHRMQLVLEGEFEGWRAIHAGGHFAAAGPIGTTTGAEVWTSPLEPLFWLHHNNLDRIWAEWQKLAPENQWSLGGTTNPRHPNTFGPDADYDFEFRDARPSDTMYLGGLKGKFEKVTVGSMFSTTGKTAPGGYESPLCYEFSTPPKPKCRK